jgi:hypothetical protein
VFLKSAAQVLADPEPLVAESGLVYGSVQKEPPGGASGPEPAGHALGRFRGGLTCKLHLTVEQGQKPLAVIVTAGRWGDGLQFIPVAADLAAERYVTACRGQRPDRGDGRPHCSSWRRRPLITSIEVAGPRWLRPVSPARRR